MYKDHIKTTSNSPDVCFMVKTPLSERVGGLSSGGLSSGFSPEEVGHALCASLSHMIACRRTIQKKFQPYS